MQAAGVVGLVVVLLKMAEVVVADAGAAEADEDGISRVAWAESSPN